MAAEWAAPWPESGCTGVSLLSLECSVFRGCSWIPELPATSSHILEVTILLNNYHVSMSFRLSGTWRPSMAFFSPSSLPIKELATSF